MLYKIPKIISPELLKILDEMGHGDELVFGDGNFPAHSNNDRVVRVDGHNVTELLDAILELFPLDTIAGKYAFVMETSDGSTPPIWAKYQEVLRKHGWSDELTGIERFAFYERAKKAYVVVETTETALYANLIIKKGVVTE